VPAFDLIRASVNLMVAAALISLATSLKLPLSTTYVTFMVAMGTSLSDQAWGRDSAVYRVSGVLTVIGGWFFTAMMAFTVSFTFAIAIFYGRGLAVAILLGLAIFLIFRTHKVHRRREQVEESVEVFNLRKIRDADAATQITFEHTGSLLREVEDVLNLGFTGLFEQDRHVLRRAREGQRRIQRWSNIIAANIFKVFRLLQWQEVELTQRYAQTISSLQEISESLRDIVVRAKKHVDNNHSGLLDVQIKELEQVRRLLVEVLGRTAKALSSKECSDCDDIAEKNRELRMLVNELDQHQIERIQDNASKTRLSILYYSLMWDSLKIAEQTAYLRAVLQEWLTVGNGTPPNDAKDPAEIED
jgi:Na+/phosphate symporter